MKKTTKYNLFYWGMHLLVFIIVASIILIEAGIERHHNIFIIVGVIGLSVFIPILMLVEYNWPYKDGYLKRMERKSLLENEIIIHYNRKKEYIHICFKLEEISHLSKICSLLNVSTLTLVDNDVGKVHKVLDENVEEDLFSEIEWFAKKPKFHSLMIFDGRTLDNINDELKYLIKGNVRFFISVNCSLEKNTRFNKC